MELLKNAKAVRFRSHLGKYLVADEDEETVRQSRNGSSQRARWGVETITGKSEVIRLKSCHGRYLTASDESFLLGMTGKKVVLEYQNNNNNNKMLCSSSSRVEWEPLKESGSNLVKLRTKASGGKFLRANGGTPPWRNSVTHDVPDRTATQDWILWNVEVLDITLSNSTTTAFDSSESINRNGSSSSSSSSSSINRIGSNSIIISSLKNDNEFAAAASPTRLRSRLSSMFSRRGRLEEEEEEEVSQSPSRLINNCLGTYHDEEVSRSSGMELFERAKLVRLQSKQQQGKYYLVADEDEETVRQSRDGSSPRARWIIEYVVQENNNNNNNFIRFKSSFGKYLTASDEAFVLGMTGKKVLQGNKRIHSSTEWQPIIIITSDSSSSCCVKLMSNQGKFLRANNNGGTPPWRNSVTHDQIPPNQDSVLWGVDVIITNILLTSQQQPQPVLSDPATPKITQLLSSSKQSSPQWPARDS
ncbi:uncharacterized protein LOC124920735 [Impatiens glandulifera]|uniref:uncharacterized protein LOC124920735 n=1 Tax=Impatiens glandulifera TaxID=253017 RepID=UPI001FB11061|nr:uncharacterized protein LOC124920735 [Impatiens glandulifera]